jgi:hypothetical protein
MLCTPRSFTPDQRRETDRRALRGQRGPTRQLAPSGDDADWRDLTDGEVSGQAKRTGVILTLTWTQWCPRHDLRSLGSQPPPCMVERRRGSPMVRRSQARQGAWRCSRASGTRWGACARERRAGGEADGRCLWSGSSPVSRPKLRRAITKDRGYTTTS